MKRIVLTRRDWVTSTMRRRAIRSLAIDKVLKQLHERSSARFPALKEKEVDDMLIRARQESVLLIEATEAPVLVANYRGLRTRALALNLCRGDIEREMRFHHAQASYYGCEDEDRGAYHDGCLDGLSSGQAQLEEETKELAMAIKARRELDRLRGQAKKERRFFL